jgi:hypothetical protein
MARNYRSLFRGDGVWVPRWVMVLCVLGLLLWFAARIFVPPMWTVQRLDAPDGSRSARLMRSVYIRHHFVVQVREGFFWQTAHYTQPIPADFRVDLEERLRWSPDSERVWLMMEGRPVWGYDFRARRNVRPDEWDEHGP